MSEHHELQILIVDDHRAMRDALELLFDVHGCTRSAPPGRRKRWR